MNPRPRLLIVDDSSVVRRALTAALTRDGRLDVAGSAPNGRTALMKIPLLLPDVLVLDIEMPERDGVETLAAVRRLYPCLPVITLAASTRSAAAATIDALTLGANDYVTKPEGAVFSDAALQAACNDLVASVGICCPGALPDAERTEAARLPASIRPESRIDVVAIGVSTGGPGALMDLIPSLPADFPIPILIVQHMPPMFTRLLAERLAANSRLPVAEARTGAAVAAGQVWIAPGDLHMIVDRGDDGVRLVTHRGAPENSCRPAVDVLFRSVAQVYGAHALAVVMTGMGRDGLRGCEQIQTAGGQVLAQDQTSSVVWGMPGFVARAGIADLIVPLRSLGPEIVDRVWRRREHPGAGVTA